MAEHSGSTDQIKKIELTSSIQSVLWTSAAGSAGTIAGIEVLTEYAGKNSDIEITLSDKSGKKFDTVKTKISGNHLWKEITVPDKAEDELYAEVKLTKHNLSKKSGSLIIVPKVEIKNLKWDKNEAGRGDVVKLSADISKAIEGLQAEIQIFEYDSDGAHDLITRFPVLIKNNKIDAEWQFEYHEDTDDIPDNEETEKGYNPPEYFFRINIAGVSADSNLLKFKDWIEIELIDADSNPVPDKKYIIELADGSKKEGNLDADGHARIENISPGPFKIEYPDAISDDESN